MKSLANCLRSYWKDMCDEDEIRCDEMNLDISGVKFAGQGFFPGAQGRLGEIANCSKIDVLVLGQDFGTFKYADNHHGFRDEECRTVVELKDFLSECNLKLERCFFSNCFMGYRTKNKMAGYLPIKRTSAYYKACLAFLEHQITATDPYLIIALGRDSAAFLSEFCSVGRFSRSASWVDINSHLSHEGTFDVGFLEKTYPVFPIVHPSYRRRNIGYRYKPYQWEETRLKNILEKM